MAFNIVDLVKDQVSDQLLGQLAGAAGADNNQTSAALGSALPGLLSGLTGAANKPGGAGALLDAVNQQDDGLLGNLGSMLGQGQGGQLAQQGNGLLGSLLGGGALGTLGKIIGGMAGMGGGGSSSLLGLLAPIVIGVLKKQVLGNGLDAGGLASMLGSQQSNINAAMPQGMSEQLTSQGFFDSIAGGAVDVNTPSVNTSGVSTPHVDVPDAPKGGLPKWLIPAVAIAALAFFGLKFLTGNKADLPDVGGVADSAKSAVSSVAEGIPAADLDAAKAALPDGINMDGLTGQIDGMFESTTGALGSITDAESATAALPQLTEASEGASKFGETFKRLPDAAKGPLSGMLKTGMSALQPLLEKAQAIPGVGSVIEPIVGPMMETLTEMAG